MPESNEPDRQLIKATVAGLTLPQINIFREFEPFYRAAAGLAETGKGGTINQFYDEFKRLDVGQGETMLLRRTLLEVGFRMEFREEELRQLRRDFASLNDEVVACLQSCSETVSKV